MKYIKQSIKVPKTINEGVKINEILSGQFYAWMLFCCKIQNGQQKSCSKYSEYKFFKTPCQFQKPTPARFKLGLTECEKIEFKARLQRVGSIEVLIKCTSKNPGLGFREI